MTLSLHPRGWLRGVLGPAILAIGAIGVVLAAPLGAQTGGSGDATVESLRQQADAASGAYFAALGRYSTLSAQISAVEAELPQLRAQEADRLQAAARRAVAAYEGAGSQQLGALITSGSVLTAARQAQWLKILNAQDNKVLVELRRTDDRLRADQRALHGEQQNAAAALSTVQAQGQAIEAKLQAAEARERQLAAAAAAAATAAANPSGGGAQAAAPAGGSPNYTPTPGQNPHHDDPFLTCVRAHEGSYTSVNPAGPYMGAYQMLQSTWDSAANHAGRTSLIGVPPNQASPYDQDDVAWALYQWQGKTPWLGDPC